jgi:hypothetical protein
MPTNVAVPVIGRGYLVGGGILGVAIVAVLIQLMLPRSGTNLAAVDTPAPAALRRSLDTGPLTLLTTMAMPGSTASAAPHPTDIGDGSVASTRVQARTTASLVARSTSARGTAAAITSRHPASTWRSDPDDAPASIDTTSPGSIPPSTTPATAAASGDVTTVGEATTSSLIGTTAAERPTTSTPPADSDVSPSTTIEVLTGALYGVSIDGSTMVIVSVEIDSPAADAGLLEGDRLVRCGGLPIATPTDFLMMAASIEPGETYEITVERDGEQVQLTLKR